MKDVLIRLLLVSVVVSVASAFKRPLLVSRNHGRLNNNSMSSSTCSSSNERGGRQRLQLDDHEVVTRRLLVDSTSLSATTPKRFKNFEEVLLLYQEEPLLVMFSAVNCGPCKLMGKEMKQVSSVLGGKFQFFRIDTEKFPHIGSRYDISALPCVLLVHHGEPVLRMEGVHKAEDVIERVRTITPV